MKIKFKPFLEGNESGKFLVNPYWLEHLLNLFYQEYYGEIWEEIMDTKVEQGNTVEDIAYGIIGAHLDKKHFVFDEQGVKQ